MPDTHQSLSVLNDKILNQAPICILEFKANGLCVFSNPAAEKLYGLTAEHPKIHNFRLSEYWRDSGIIRVALEVPQGGGQHRFKAIVGKRRLHIFGTLSCVYLSIERHLLAIFSAMSDKVDSERALVTAKEIAVNNLKRALLAEKQLANIGDETRKSIGQELHDDLGQHLTGLAFIADNLAHNLQVKNLPEATEAQRINQLIQEAIEKTRTLAGQLYRHLSIEADLQTRLLTLLRNVETTFGISCELNYSTVIILHQEVASNLFRIVQEAVNNAIKHSGASQIKISFSQTARAIVLQVADNGSGMANPQDSGVQGLGMQIMHARANLCGATLTIEPVAAGGTNLFVSLPS